MLEIKIVLEAAELSAAMQRLAEALEGRGITPQPDPAPETPAPKPEAEAQPEPQAAPQAAPVAPAPSIADIANAGAALVNAGRRDDLIALLAKYGAKAVTQLSPDQLPAVAADLRAMGAQI